MRKLGVFARFRSTTLKEICEKEKPNGPEPVASIIDEIRTGIANIIDTYQKNENRNLSSVKKSDANNELKIRQTKYDQFLWHTISILRQLKQDFDSTKTHQPCPTKESILTTREERESLQEEIFNIIIKLKEMKLNKATPAWRYELKTFNIMLQEQEKKIVKDNQKETSLNPRTSQTR